jgi:predicted dehydrogenase
MPAKTIRFGVIGCGVIACWTHLPLLRRLKNTTLVAATDPHPEAREKASQLTHVPIYENARELLERDDIDAVVICSPSHSHAELAIAAAKAHKHFYLEKPIASTVPDGRRVIDAVKDAGVSAAIGFNRRFHPAFEQARALVAAGRIGRVRAIVTVFSEPVPVSVTQEWRGQRRTGGGVLLDLASHHVDLVRWVLGCEPTEIEGRIKSDASEEDSAWLRLTMADGSEVSGFFSYRTGLTEYIEFIGELGTVRVDRHRFSVSLRLTRRVGYGSRSAAVFPSHEMLAARMIRAARPSHDPSYGRALAAFVEMLNGGPSRVADLYDGLRSLETIAAAEEAARAALSPTLG